MSQTVALHPSAPWVAFPTTEADRAAAGPAFKTPGQERAASAGKTEVAAGLAVTVAAKGAPRAADLLLRAGA